MPLSILFVCYENICRSPMAEGIFTNLLTEHDLHHTIHVSSAGTVSYQRGSSPDQRAIALLSDYGIDISSLKAQSIDDLTLHTYDWIFTMDYETYEAVQQSLATQQPPHLHLMMDFVEELAGEEVPDPYYNGMEAFDGVRSMLTTAAEAILAMLKERYRDLRE
jgi:protein-tyrosine phosphatase